MTPSQLAERPRTSSSTLRAGARSVPARSSSRSAARCRASSTGSTSSACWCCPSRPRNAGGITRDVLIGAVPPAGDQRLALPRRVACSPGSLTFFWYSLDRPAAQSGAGLRRRRAGALRGLRRAEGARLRPQPGDGGAARHADRHRRRHAARRPRRARCPRCCAATFTPSRRWRARPWSSSGSCCTSGHGRCARGRGASASPSASIFHRRGWSLPARWSERTVAAAPTSAGPIRKLERRRDTGGDIVRRDDRTSTSAETERRDVGTIASCSA